MGSQWGRDRVYLKARNEGYRSRAAYKLTEIQRRFHLINPSDNVVDLGAAPGSWLQVVRTLTGGRVLGIDLSPIPPIDGVETMEADFSDSLVQVQAKTLLGIVNVVLSDAAPKLSGQRSYDQARVVTLGEEALGFARAVLKPGGNFVVKSFQGTDFPELLAQIKQSFYSVKTFVPKSTRRGSTEMYVIAKNFRQ